MRLYRVPGTMTISMMVDVVASSPEEAKEKAECAGVQSLCHQCASHREIGEWNTSGELDGQPEINADDEVLDMGEAPKVRRRGR